jgi:hypothetical protein
MEYPKDASAEAWEKGFDETFCLCVGDCRRGDDKFSLRDITGARDFGHSRSETRISHNA